MSSLDEKTPKEVAQEYDIPYKTLLEKLRRPSYGFTCPFPVRKFEGRWLIDTGSEEWQAYIAFYGQQHVVKARRAGRLTRGYQWRKAKQ